MTGLSAPTISWLASGLPKPRHEAYRWLNEGGPDLAKQLPAKDRYDAACLYALAARADSNRLRREQAALLLIQALHLDADTPDRRLWAQAEHDPQLAGLPVAELAAALEAALTNAYPATRLSRGQLHQIVDQEFPFYRK